MKANVGGIDRVARVVLAAVAVALGLGGVVGGVLTVVLYVVGAALLLTAGVGNCPLYTVLGVTTRKGATSGA